jgi:SAM-dependent methyltransferase
MSTRTRQDTRERSAEQARAARRAQQTRRHPRPTQFYFLHLRYLLRDLSAALKRVPGPVADVLDVFCGARPYEDLLPEGSRCVGLDIADDYGLADVVTDEFLPFADDSFDLVLCLEAFHYVPDPAEGVSEIRRVLRPGGTTIISVPLVWAYNPSILEHRYTGPELVQLFEEWDEVTLVENGGRAVAWACLTDDMVRSVEKALRARVRAAVVLHPAFAAACLLVNVLAGIADRLECRRRWTRTVLPMNLLVSARRPREP